MSKKQLDNAIDAAYRKHGNGVQIMMMDIPRLFNDARNAFANGGDIEAAVIEAIAKYRKN